MLAYHPWWLKHCSIYQQKAMRHDQLEDSPLNGHSPAWYRPRSLSLMSLNTVSWMCIMRPSPYGWWSLSTDLLVACLIWPLKFFRADILKNFFISSHQQQLDVDRLDYLFKRDSFYTGVVEGNINRPSHHDDDVSDQNLILEEKSIYTIEKFLSRRIMYLQDLSIRLHSHCWKDTARLLYRDWWGGPTPHRKPWHSTKSPE